MNLQELKVSGLLELYIMGILDAEQRHEVEAAIKRYPQLYDHIQEISEAIYHFADLHKVKTPQYLKNYALDSLDEVSVKTASRSIDVRKTKKSKSTYRSSSTFPWKDIVMGVLATLLFVTLAFFLWSKSSKSQQINESDISNEQLNSKLLQLQNQNKELSNQLEWYQYFLNGNAKVEIIEPNRKYSGDVNVSVYPDAPDGKDYIQFIQLPPLSNDEQYHLWSVSLSEDVSSVAFWGSNTSGLKEITIPENYLYLSLTIQDKSRTDRPNVRKLLGIIKSASKE